MELPKVGSIGEYIRRQRQLAKISLRQLAVQAGVSNPYLSQIERGLRKPSAEVLNQIAKGLHSRPRRCTCRRGSLRTASPALTCRPRFGPTSPSAGGNARC
jgi:transcriptional regulator with XRE-family HTH domain